MIKKNLYKLFFCLVIPIKHSFRAMASIEDIEVMPCILFTSLESPATKERKMSKST